MATYRATWQDGNLGEYNLTLLADRPAIGAGSSSVEKRVRPRGGGPVYPYQGTFNHLSYTFSRFAILGPYLSFGACMQIMELASDITKPFHGTVRNGFTNV